MTYEHPTPLELVARRAMANAPMLINDLGLVMQHDDMVAMIVSAMQHASRAETGQEMYNRVEREYWAQHPEAVPTNIKVGERVIAPGSMVGAKGSVVMNVTEVRDDGRTVTLADTFDPNFRVNALAYKVQRI